MSQMCWTSRGKISKGKISKEKISRENTWAPGRIGGADKKMLYWAALPALAAGFAVHSVIPALYHKYRNPEVIRRTGVPRTVMLTFDDGPDPDYTGRLLDLLKKEEVRAVFFTVTREAEGQEALIRRMIDEGHVVGFHSMDHQNAMVRGFFHTRKDFMTGAEFLKRHGVTELYYRPPWGLSNVFTWYYVKKYGMKMVLWDVMAEDWEAKATVGSIRKKCLSRVSDGSIICLHDGGKNSGGAPGAPQKTLEALAYIIPALKQAGYRFILPGEGI